jgi:predicted ribosome quality control (RQC) complex YloA/Tae2 family protein
MEIEIDLKKTLEQNAAEYFEKSKKAKRTIIGLEKAILAQKQKQPKKIKENKKERKKNWFEKYRWFVSSNNFLVVGGKNAKQNEEIVKKQMKKEDIYFHAEVFGAPHCIIKTKNEKGKLREVPEETMKEAGEFAVTYSKAFESGQSSADAYSVSPEQVSKRAPTGQSMGTGAFMIYGERKWYKKSPISLAIGYYPKTKSLMAGPLKAIKQNCNNILELKQGRKDKNKIARELTTYFNKKGFSFSNDEVLSLLPNGDFDFI